MTKYRDTFEHLKGFVSCFLQMLRGYQDTVIPTFAIAVATRLQRSTTPLGIPSLSISPIFPPLANKVYKNATSRDEHCLKYHGLTKEMMKRATSKEALNPIDVDPNDM